MKPEGMDCRSAEASRNDGTGLAAPRHGRWWRRLRYALFGVVAALALAEGSVRAFGMVDFPRYKANAQIGYIPEVNQQGSFLNQNDWRFSAVHVGASALAPVLMCSERLVAVNLVNSFKQRCHPLQAKLRLVNVS